MGNHEWGSDPSPAEIKTLCKQIQETWSDAERERRLVGEVKVLTDDRN